MRKVLILRNDENPHSLENRNANTEADVILTQVLEFPKYFYILKHRDMIPHRYISSSQVAEFLLGNEVRLYNRAELHNEGDDEWKADERELYAQMDETLNNMKRNERPMNALSRMEIDD